MSVALPTWATLVRADNPGPMTLEGTNTWVLRADDGVVVVDPGPLMEDHLAAVAALGSVLVTVLTHGHPDHSEGAARFAELTGAPVTARDPRLCIGADPLAIDEDTWPVAGLRVTTLHTPGHTADSVSLLVSGPDGTSAVLTGDTILGRGTTVVAHPDGRLADYLASLRRLAALGPVTVLPGHGPVLGDAADAAQGYLRHRESRLEQVRAALGAGARTADDVVRTVYADVDRAVWPAARLSVQAQLDFLAEQGAGRAG